MLHARVIGGHGRSQEVELFSQMSSEILHSLSVAHEADGVAKVRRRPTHVAYQGDFWRLVFVNEKKRSVLYQAYSAG